MRSMDTHELAAGLPCTLYVPLVLGPHDTTMMASDGYTPSAKGCTALGRSCWLTPM